MLEEKKMLSILVLVFDDMKMRMTVVWHGRGLIEGTKEGWQTKG